MNRKCKSIIRNVVKQAGEEEDFEIIQYGISLGVSYIIFFIVCTCISLFMRNGMKGILMLIPFYFIRIYAGGYHASTRTGCWVVSIGLILLANLYLLHPIESTEIEYIVAVVLMVNLYLTAPVEAKNKRLSDSERKIYKKRTGVTLIVYFLLITAGNILSDEWIGNLIFVSLLLSNILVIF